MTGLKGQVVPNNALMISAIKEDNEDPKTEESNSENESANPEGPELLKPSRKDIFENTLKRKGGIKAKELDEKFGKMRINSAVEKKKKLGQSLHQDQF